MGFQAVPARRKAFIALLGSTMLATSPAFAQAAAEEGVNDEIIVTAQKREENLQDVPISIQALGTKKLDQLNVANFNDYTKLLPSVSFQTSQPGVTTVYMRGVASGGDGNHSGSLPSVGVYLDEQPVTTIGGTLDIHVYDIARVESLAGPQGTLYGASSEAGTIRIITNKPSTAGFEGRVDGEINTVRKGGVGGNLEGMANFPLGDNIALRMVGWYQRDAGYIDNVPGTRSFLPQPGGITVNNNAFVEKNYNEGEIYGGRAALKIDLDDSWTVTPTVLYQHQKNTGSYGTDPRVGDLQVQHFLPEFRKDRFIQAALTIEGTLGNWDLTYAGAYLDRKTNAANDYTDYSEAYDSLYSSVGGLAGYFYINDALGNVIDPRQNVLGTDHFKKMSQEFRIASPSGDRFRIVAGLFYQRQSNQIHQDYRIANLAPDLSVNGLPGTLWLTQQYRVDKDYAAFGEASFDILDNLTVTAGGRAFIYDNSLIGFFGFGRNPGIDPADGRPFTASPFNAAGSSRTGVAGCFTPDGRRLREAFLNGGSTALLPAEVAGGPCTNLAIYTNGDLRPVKAKGQGFTHRLNLTWKPTDDLLVYGTWSRGFRPGGINRRADVAPYSSDFLTNYELGLKSTMLDGMLRANVAFYQQDWKSFQFSYLGANSFTEIHNGPDARIRGLEADLSFRPSAGLSFTVAGAYTDAKTRQNLCSIDDPTFLCTADPANFIAAPKGTRLPITPKFKFNATARYEFDMGSMKPYVQALVAHQGSASSDIRTAVSEVFSGNIINPAALQGKLRAYTTADFAVGSEWGNFSAELFVQNLFDERAELSRFIACGSCFQRVYTVTSTPRTIGLRMGAKF